MSCNFYARINICKVCKRFNEIHLGKQSVGWKFAIEMHEGYYRDYKEFLQFIKRKDVKIFDEYGRKISPQVMIKGIKAHSKDKSHFKDYPQERKMYCEEADLCFYEFS
jgi:hypothetical protein